MTTMLQLVQQASGEMGLAVPTAVASSTNTDLIQILALMNAAGQELTLDYDWQALDKEYRFTTVYYTLTGTTTSGSPIVTGISSTTDLVALTFMVTGTGINQDTYILTVDSPTQVTLTQDATASGTVSLLFAKTIYALPSDYYKIVDVTQWDKTKHWQMLGPCTAQQWQWIKSGFIATGPRVRWRLLAGTFEVWPPMSSNEYLGFEYMGNGWATSASGTAKTAFTVDTDTCVFPDRLMVLFTKLKYFEIKGFDTTALARDYTRFLDVCKANDKGSATLSLAPRMNSNLIGWWQIPDSGYGS